MNGRSKQLDRIDKRILDALSHDGRMTKVLMSEVVGLSATRCWERVRKMEKAGIIRGYHADIDLRTLAGLMLYQAHVRLANSTSTKAQLFERHVKDMDFILSCHATLGSFDYEILVAARDTFQFNAVMDQILKESGVDFEFTTSSIYKTVKPMHSSSIVTLAMTDDDAPDP